MKLKCFPLGLFARDDIVPPALMLICLTIAAVCAAGLGMWPIENHALSIMHMGLATAILPAKISTRSTLHDDQSDSYLESIAYEDPLTTLRNRRGLNEDFKAVSAQDYDADKRCALLLLDLDRFKFINDTLGHAAGDKLLKDIASRVRDICDNDQVCYRLGGDEFVILWTGGPSFLEVDNFCKEIKHCFSDPFKFEKSQIEGGGSVGITWQNGNDKSLGALLKRADLALYKAKSEAGSTHCFFCDQMEVENRRSNKIKSELRDLIIQKRFDVFYQPLARVDDFSVDILSVRGAGIRNGVDILSQQQYLEELSETGLVVQYDRAVLERVMSDAASAEQKPLILLHMTSRQLIDPAFVAYFIELLELHSLSGERFILAFENFEDVEKIPLANTSINELSELGVKIGSYGFGVDFSLLASNPRTQNRYLILQRNWSSKMTTDASSFELLQHLIRLANGVGMQVVLDGVDFAEQALLLKDFPDLVIKGEIAGKTRREIC